MQTFGVAILPDRRIVYEVMIQIVGVTEKHRGEWQLRRLHVLVAEMDLHEAIHDSLKNFFLFSETKP